jgi:hypothetical protein
MTMAPVREPPRSTTKDMPRAGGRGRAPSRMKGGLLFLVAQEDLDGHHQLQLRWQPEQTLPTRPA